MFPFCNDDQQREVNVHYYQHHIGDFIKATARLSDNQTMAYLRLLWMYYDSEKPLPLDSKILAFQIGASQDDVDLLLSSFFVLSVDGWRQTRCDKEIAEYRTFRGKKSAAGRASAERRKNNSSTPVEQVLNECSTDVQLTTNHKPITNNHKPTKTKAVVTAPPDGVSVEVWDSFIAIRKAKRAPMTTVALEGIQREAAKAGVSLQEALATCCTRGWQSFKASWTVEQVTESQRAREHMAELTRGMATPKPKNFWEKTIDETNEVIHVETKRLL